jgi:serine/threonine protein phosphatase PrpC
MQHLIHSVIDSDGRQRVVPVALLRLEDLGLYAIAECGAHGADGKAAAQIALDAVRTHASLHEDLFGRFRTSPTDLLRNEIISVLRDAMARAGQELFALIRRKSLPHGVGLDILLTLGDEAFAAHVGHGEILLLRKDLLHHLTLVHPNASDDSAQAPADDAPRRRLLGEEPRVHIETLCVSLLPGDRVILASGSLAASLDDRDIRSFAGALPPPQAIQGLLNLAREKAPSRPTAVLLFQVPTEEAPSSGDSLSRLAVLTRMPLFAYCSQEELHSIASVALPRFVSRGERIFSQGEPGQEIFLVVHGEVAILRDGFEVARVGSGTNFGEMAMLDEPTRSASAVAVCDTELLLISRETFFGLLMGNPTLAVKILWNMLLKLSDNLRRTTTVLADVASAGGPPGRKLKPTDIPW